MGARGPGAKKASNNKSLAVTERLAAPATLPPGIAARWDAIVQSLPADYFTSSDISLLTAYCWAEHRHDQAQNDLNVIGLYQTDERSGEQKAHPAIKIACQLAGTMASLATKLRLCASARMSTAEVNTRSKESRAAKKPWEQLDEED